MSLFELSPLLQYVLVICLGLAIGSFLNSFIWRLHQSEPITSKRSICIHCSYQLSWSDNIPIVSFIFLKGKCRTCAEPIPWHYPIVELVTALGFCTALYLNQGNTPELIRDFIAITILVGIFIADALYFSIPTILVGIGSIMGIVLNVFFLHISPLSLLIGTIIGGGFFALQYLISRGRWIGSGDIMMGIMMGIWLGWPAILVALLIAYIGGALFASGLLIMKRKRLQSQIPFGTFLAIGTLLTLWGGREIITWYVDLLK